jgi:hypothetical protein
VLGELSGQVAAHTPVHHVSGLNFCVSASMVGYRLTRNEEITHRAVQGSPCWEALS